MAGVIRNWSLKNLLGSRLSLTVPQEQAVTIDNAVLLKTGGSIVVSVHPRIHNKPAIWYPDYAVDWQPLGLASLEDLRSCVGRGQAFIPVLMSSNRRTSDAFVQSDLAVVDIDHGLTVANFRQHPLASSAAWIYTTASHSPAAERFRIVFRLPQRVDDLDLYKAIVTLLSRALGGDKSCTDPCRLFYGNDGADHPLWQPEAKLPGSILDDAAAEVRKGRLRYDQATANYDERTIQQAIFCLEQILAPTIDGQRDHFIKVTAAASSAGEAIYPAWCDWASRGHHGSGKNSRQASERFFRGFHGRSTLATIFYLADEESPGWRRLLPEELRSEGHWGTKISAAGYDHEDFLGLDDEENERPYTEDTRTPSLFDEDRAWLALPQPPVPSPERLPQPGLDLEEGLGPVVDQEPDSEPDANNHRDGLPANTTYVSDDDYDDDGDLLPPLDDEELPMPEAPRERRQRQSPGEAELVKERLDQAYPDLRLNLLTQRYEYRDHEVIREIEDISTAYIRISRGLEKFPPKTAVTDMVRYLGRKRAYHPVRDYLDHCAATVEPCPFFSCLGSEILGMPEDELKNPILSTGERLGDVVLKRWLIAAVARAYEPGCPMQWMPILVGEQDVGKSRFLEFLTPPSPSGTGRHPWTAFSQHPLKSLAERPHQLHCGWIVVLDETERHFKRDQVEIFKNMVSISVDRSARKYENELDFPRAFVLVGATNTDTFLKDPTGNRRFLPIYVSGKQISSGSALPNVDLQRLCDNRDAIWAAAVHAYTEAKRQGKQPWHFHGHELAEIKEYMDGFYADNSFASKLMQLTPGAVRNRLGQDLGQCDGMYYILMDQLYDYLDIPIDRHNSVTLHLSDALKRVGFTSRRIRLAGKRPRVWMLPRQEVRDFPRDPQVMPAVW